MLSNNQQAFLALVRAGLWENEIKISQYEPIDYKEVYRFAQEQAVVGLVAAGLEHVTDTKIPQEITLSFVGEALQLEQRNTDMNSFIDVIVEDLRKADIYTLLLKGQGIAQCYERPLWRALGDVDLFLSESNYKKAKDYIISRASSVEDENSYYKHIALIIGSWPVELHGTLRVGLWKSVETVLDEVQDVIFFNGAVRSWMNGTTQIFLPKADEDVAIYVFSHILQHTTDAINFGL